MKKVEIISASAGSGKTTRIARVLREGIERGEVRPAAVLATTFTNKAAAELKERVRSELIRAGQGDAALQLEGARIGTVNAVCGRLVGDFALELGLSPRLRVLDEDQARLGVRRALSGVVNDAEKATLEGLQFRLNEFDWRGAVDAVMAHARTNRLSPQALVQSRDESLALLLQHLPPVSICTEAELDAQLVEVLSSCLAQINLDDDTTRGTKDAYGLMQDLLQEARLGPAKWKTWAKLSKVTARKKSEPFVEVVREFARQVDAHPRLRADLQAAITLVFDLAGRTMAVWQEEKRQRGVLDFVDQEVRALELLEDPAFSARLAEELDLVLVDEFQDTSPLQLALFMRLASLARRSVWVGDQKQAIFGFRGTDPALMDAVMESLLGGDAPEILGHSHRSRPALVELTSSLFAGAFAPHGIPPERVKLVPFEPVEPAGLGAPIEWWNIDGKNWDLKAAGLADGVRRLLVDPTVKVRDRQRGEVRAVRAGDVAVLCRKNTTCQAVAEALARHGVSATVFRGGLLTTPEARAAFLGLRLFVDPRDRLAAAELALLLEHPHEPGQWLDLALQNEGKVPFEGAAFHQQLSALREHFPVAGPLAALDLAVEALGLREVVPRWGDGALRSANLDALRAHAVDYVNLALTEGSAATAAGLIAHLDELEELKLDTQARLPGEDAVVVATWHAAKGLEWPITVLSALDEERDPPMFGLSVQSKVKTFDLASPLAGRWLRYWPNPFHGSQTTALRESLQAGPEAKAEQERSEKQELRLLYVGWTRARDVLAIASKTPQPWQVKWLDGVRRPEGSGPVRWGGVTVEARLRDCDVELPAAEDPRPDALSLAKGPQEHPPAWVSPSTLEGEAANADFHQLGQRMTVDATDMNELGQAVHGFLAADRPEFGAARRLELAQQCLSNWQQPGAVRPEELVEASTGLRRWVDAAWPGAVWHRELPVSLKRADGSMLRGTADLVLELEDGFVLVDHKSYPGSDAEAKKRALTFKGQLDAYAEAIGAAWGKPLQGAFIHLPMLGQVARLR